MPILNLGCGNKILKGPGVVNHDRIKHRPEVNCVWDLNDLPWPWEDNTFELVIACAVLEHLPMTLIQSMNECWRILKPGGRIRVKVPWCRSEQSYSDPTHYWQFSLRTFDFFDPNTKFGSGYAFYPTRKWKLLRPTRLNKERTSVIAMLQVRK